MSFTTALTYEYASSKQIHVQTQTLEKDRNCAKKLSDKRYFLNQDVFNSRLGLYVIFGSQNW